MYIICWAKRNLNTSQVYIVNLNHSYGILLNHSIQNIYINKKIQLFSIEIINE